MLYNLFSPYKYFLDNFVFYINMKIFYTSYDLMQLIRHNMIFWVYLSLTQVQKSYIVQSGTKKLYLYRYEKTEVLLHQEQATLADFWRSSLDNLAYFLLKIIQLFGSPIFWLWADAMKVISETRYAHYIKYLPFYTNVRDILTHYTGQLITYCS